MIDERRAVPIKGQDDAVDGALVWCPGCEERHFLPTRPIGDRPCWSFNGDYDRPTFAPSLLISKDDPSDRCHSLIRDGQIQFLGDCHHALAGKTVPLPIYWTKDT